ncbi:hypothetical protein [Methanobrevibacter sp.]
MRLILKESSIILMVLIVFIITISTISAADTDTVNLTISSNDNTDLEIIQEFQSDASILSADDAEGTYKDLNDEIKKGNEINLDKNYAFNKDIDAGLEKGIIINKTLTINGNGHTINSTNLTKLFDITATGNLTLNNIILISDYGTYDLFNSNREDATIRNNGIGAFNNITFTTVKQVGGTGKESIGASICNRGQMIITDSRFVDSKITSYTQTSYGLIENTNELIIKNTLFDNNFVEITTTYSITYVNALIYNSGKLTLNTVNATNNKIKTKNSAQGMIKAANSNSEITIHNSLFENNTIIAESNSAHGAAIHAESGNLKIYHSKFIKNTGTYGSGAIRDGAESIYINNTFEKNSAINSGAIYCYNLKSTFINNTFIENIAEEDCGALYINFDMQNDRDHPFTNNIFIGNVAGRDGGAIYASKSLGNYGSPIENNVFINNDAKRNGGAILYSPGYGSKYFIKNSLFKGNIANNYAVISNFQDSSSELTIQNSIFENNKVRSKSGVLVQYRIADFENNYWGTNDPDFTKIGINTPPSKIVIMTIEGDETPTSNAIYTIIFKDNITGETVKMPAFSVNITSNKNAPTPNSIMINDGTGSFNLKIEQSGEDIIRALVDGNEKANITINVSIKVAEFKIIAYDVTAGEKLNLTFDVTSGPETCNYTWTIYDADNNVIETGEVTKNNEINYTKFYPAGNYTITIKLKNVDGWSDKEVNASFEIKKIPDANNSTKPQQNETTNNKNNTKPSPKPSQNKSNIKKAKTKITAKKKTFKAKQKVKKYTITLKSGNKPIKKVLLTLNIKGKTYKAKTNVNGKATFKIKKLSKKRKYTAVIKFKGNSNYTPSTKKVKIIIK